MTTPTGPSHRLPMSCSSGIADDDDAPDTVQADARDYLQYLEAALFGSGSLTGEARGTVTGDLHNAREVFQRLPRPR